MPYVEKDVSRDQQAAQEMVRRTGQMGVPVITVDDSVVVGFDQPGLERLLAAVGGQPKRLGASVAPVNGSLLVGQVHPGSLAAWAGLRGGDVILSIDGNAVATPEQLTNVLAASLRGDGPVKFAVRRDGKREELRLVPPLQ